MIKEIITADSEKLVINIPKEYIGKKLEVLIFSENEVNNRKEDTKKILEEFRKYTKNPIKVDPNIDITKLDEDMYNDIF